MISSTYSLGNKRWVTLDGVIVAIVGSMAFLMTRIFALLLNVLTHHILLQTLAVTHRTRLELIIVDHLVVRQKALEQLRRLVDHTVPHTLVT